MDDPHNGLKYSDDYPQSGLKYSHDDPQTGLKTCCNSIALLSIPDTIAYINLEFSHQPIRFLINTECVMNIIITMVRYNDFSNNCSSLLFLIICYNFCTPQNCSEIMSIYSKGQLLWPMI